VSYTGPRCCRVEVARVCRAENPASDTLPSPRKKNSLPVPTSIETPRRAPRALGYDFAAESRKPWAWLLRNASPRRPSSSKPGFHQVACMTADVGHERQTRLVGRGAGAFHPSRSFGPVYCWEKRILKPTIRSRLSLATRAASLGRSIAGLRVPPCSGCPGHQSDRDHVEQSADAGRGAADHEATKRLECQCPGGTRVDHGGHAPHHKIRVGLDSVRPDVGKTWVWRSISLA